MANVLLIEDDLDIRQLMAQTLSARGHSVESTSTAMSGLEIAVSGTVDAVILDLGLPDLDGGDLLRMIRAVSAVPIIIATARSDEREIVGLLDAGADDYLVKPFSATQLEARMRAVLRRGTSTDTEAPITVGDLVIDTGSRDVTFAGTPVELSPREFDFLAYLAARAGQVVSKRKLLAEVWREPYGGSDRTIDVHLSSIRRKLGESASDATYLHTIRGVGIKLVDPNR